MHRKKRITLLRHAKAIAGAGSMADRDRPLNDRGRRDAPLMGRRLHAAGARPGLILTSPAARALETARLVARELRYPLERLQLDSDLYLASPQEILDVIARQDETLSDIVVCGHNPGLTELLNQVTGADIDNLPTCGFGVIEAAIDTWDTWRTLRHGELLHFDYPRKPEETAG